MALHEVHCSLFAFYCLDEGVGQLLFAVRNDPLHSPFVVENDRAVRLHFELSCSNRVLVDVDVFDGDLW